MAKRMLTLSCALLVLVSICTGAAAQELGPGSDPPPTEQVYVPGQLLVRFRPSVSAVRASQILVERSASRLRRVRALDVHVLRLPPGLSVERAVEVFGHVPEVEYAEPNYILHVAQVDDPGLSNQWAPQAMDAPAAWDITTGDPSVTIAVVDTGIDYLHSELAPNIWANPEEIAGDSGVDDDGNGYIDDVRGWDFINGDADPMDDYNHGTHVAGIAAAADNDITAGLVGICANCTIMAVKVLDAGGSGPVDVVADGITYAADNGARVVNLSLGSILAAATLEQAVNYAWDQGAVVVAAAGNDGIQTPFYPASYANAIGVVSTNNDDHRSCYSNYGSPLVSVSAPGESIYSTLRRDGSGSDGYGKGSGTSMAAPHVSGLAGLLFSQVPGPDNGAVRALIETTTEDLGPTGTDPYFGTGRINAYRALTEDGSVTSPPAGLLSNWLTASGYAHARKLARDASGRLHLVWHGQDGSEYRLLYATSTDGGDTWDAPQMVFTSTAETYHPALAVGGAYAYVAFPSKHNGALYETFFTRKLLSGGPWSEPTPLMGGTYDAVRPDLFVDPSDGRLHLVASSLDNAPYVHYRASSAGGMDWGPIRSVDPTTPTTASNTRYATVHANGSNIYVAARTVTGSLLKTYYLHTVRSPDGGETWSDQTKISSYVALSTGEYGVSLAGVGDRLYMTYEVGGNLYFRRFDGTAWSAYLLLESSGRWPTVAQADDGQAWMIWEDAGSLLMRHYTGTSWEPAETVLEADDFGKGYYPNLMLGTGGGRVEWVATHCSGAPFRLMADRRPAGADAPPSVSIVDPVESQIVGSTYRVLVSAGDDNALTAVELSIDGGAHFDITDKHDGMHHFYDWDTTAYANGAHTLQARATDDAAQSTDSMIENVTVDNNQPPVASFTYSCTDLACDFDAFLSSDPDGGNIVSYAWDFGDGSDTATGVTATHTYTSASTYAVILVVTDDEGATDDDSQDVTVNGPARMHVGDLDGTKTRVKNKWMARVTIAVHDASHNPVSGATVTGIWSDGTTGTGECATDGIGTCQVSKGISNKVPSVTFTVNNVTHATLTYDSTANHDPDGDSNGTTITVPPPVEEPPVATFTYTCTDLTCDFDASLSYDPDGGNIVGYVWGFGDGSDTVTGVTAIHTYASASMYAVILVVTDDEGATDDEIQDITVSEEGSTMHVGDLEGTSGPGRRNRWNATVEIAVHNQNCTPLPNATVTGSWSAGATGSSTCTTGASSRCTVTKSNVKGSVSSVKFTVDSVMHATNTYAPGDNHDLDGDSNGTSITVTGPLRWL